jgi:HAD superfamily hydrolase (TIGR01459 family)
MTGQPATTTRLRELAPLYDIFFVDQFGVLHDGTRPYPGAVDALRRLHGERRKVVILSNSGKRSAANEARLAALGFDPSGWTLFLSSGEVAWKMLEARPADARPQRCLVLSRDADASPIEGLGIAQTDSAEDADLVLIAGSEAPQRTLDDYRGLLSPAAARGVRALCVNPDVTMLVPGGMAFGSGRIARLYEELGGSVTWIGKPHPEIYRAAFAIVGNGRALGIGDSVEHDVVGAKGAGADAALVLGGIHAGDDPEALYARYGAKADHVLAKFAW